MIDNSVISSIYTLFDPHNLINRTLIEKLIYNNMFVPIFRVNITIYDTVLMEMCKIIPLIWAAKVPPMACWNMFSFQIILQKL